MRRVFTAWARTWTPVPSCPEAGEEFFTGRQKSSRLSHKRPGDMPTIDNGQREVIAHFSVTKLTLAGPFLVAVSGTFLFFWGHDVVLTGFFKVPPPNPT